VLVGNHLFVIFAVLDVSCAVNSCINHSFLHLYNNNNPIYKVPKALASMSVAIHHAQLDCFYQSVVWHTTYMAK